MRRYLLLAISLTGLAATAFLFWHLSPASAADDVKTIEIVKNADGKFVFSDPNAKITAGQSVKWVAKDADVPHQLVPDTEDDALTDTSTFDSSTTPTQKFRAAGTIHITASFMPRA